MSATPNSSPARAETSEPAAPRPVQLRLANGLRVTLLHAPGQSRAAAALRIDAGSHDAPLTYPGLAHFLEHLVFLGSAAFPAGDGLIPFVQAQGGQVNASTRERHTDFFFELPPAACEQGLARLCDMLAKPILNLEAQLNEREVVHAEFLAWSRDASSAPARALAEVLPAAHPLAGFHAGNRDSLRVEKPTFQQALRDFHRRFYHAGQASLVLLGPQPLAELCRLAEEQGGRLRQARAVPRPAVPSLLPLRAQSAGLAQDRALSLVFVLEALPAAADEALDFLCCWLARDEPGGWYGYLLERRLVESLSIRPSYHHAGQATLQLDLLLGDAGQDSEALTGPLFNWLHFFAAQDDWRELRGEYTLLQRRQLQVLPPLALARHYLARPAAQAPGLSDAGLSALRAVLDQLRPERLMQLQGEQVASPRPSPLAPPAWRLPPGNPLLRTALRSGGATRAATTLPGLHVLPLPGARDRGALFLRWQFAHPPCGQQALLASLQASLEPLRRHADQAGLRLRLRLERCGAAWELSLVGLAQVIPAALAAVLELWRACSPDLLDQGQRLRALRSRQGAGQMLLRQLLLRLETLPDTADPTALGATPAMALAERWLDANWDALALGLEAAELGAVQALLPHLPGRPAPPIHPARACAPGRLWQDAGIDHPEHALLLLCPQPEHTPSGAALWQLLAQLYQGPFFQRMRGELQLGYGVFAGYRRVAGRAGILFAVQSPHAPVPELLRQIEAFLAQQGERLATLDDAELARQREQLVSQFDEQGLNFAELTEQRWWAYKAGHEPGARALAEIDRQALLAAHLALPQAENGWLGLANAAPPDTRWRPTAPA